MKSKTFKAGNEEPVVIRVNNEVDWDTGFRQRAVYGICEHYIYHTHEGFQELLFVLTDSIESYANGVHQELKRGNLVFFREHDFHYLGDSVSNEISTYNFTFTNELMQEIFDFLTPGFCSQELLAAETPPCVLLKERDVEWIIKQIDQLNAVPLSDAKARQYHSKVFLLNLFTRYFSGVGSMRSDIPRWLANLDKDMHKPENFRQSTAHMVELSGKSRAHLGRMLMEHYGKTIPEYINDLRLNYCANQLFNSDRPILEICYDCGFENINWMYRLFKKKYGMPPRQFREHMDIHDLQEPL